MPTHKEKYNHDGMTTDELEERAAADLYELHSRLLQDVRTKAIGHLIWTLMSQFRQAYRTAELIKEVNE